MPEGYDAEHRRLEDRLQRNETRLNVHGDKLDILETSQALQAENTKMIYKKLDFIDKRFDAMDTLSFQIQTLTTTVAVMTEQLKTNNDKTDSSLSEIKELKAKDSENHTYYKRGITMAIVGALISILVAIAFGAK